MSVTKSVEVERHVVGDEQPVMDDSEYRQTCNGCSSERGMSKDDMY